MNTKASNYKFVSASFILGIMTIISTFMMTVYLPFIFGGLAIIMAILSKTNEKEFLQKARIGIITAVIGIVMNVVIVASSIYTVFSNPVAYKEFDKMFEQIYGQSFEETMEQIQSGSNL